MKHAIFLSAILFLFFSPYALSGQRWSDPIVREPIPYTQGDIWRGLELTRRYSRIDSLDLVHPGQLVPLYDSRDNTFIIDTVQQGDNLWTMEDTWLASKYTPPMRVLYRESPKEVEVAPIAKVAKPENFWLFLIFLAITLTGASLWRKKEEKKMEEQSRH